MPAPFGRPSPLAIPSYRAVLRDGRDDQALDLVGAFVDLQQPDSGTSCALALRAAMALRAIPSYSPILANGDLGTSCALALRAAMALRAIPSYSPILANGDLGTSCALALRAAIA